MLEQWERVGNGKYKIELDGWNFVVERVDMKDCSGLDNSIDASGYRFELYENMNLPQSASALEVRIIDGDKLSVHRSNHPGAIRHITDYIRKENVFQYEGIPEPLKSNLMHAFELARINLNL